MINRDCDNCKRKSNCNKRDSCLDIRLVTDRVADFMRPTFRHWIPLYSQDDINRLQHSFDVGRNTQLTFEEYCKINGIV